MTEAAKNLKTQGQKKGLRITNPEVPKRYFTLQEASYYTGFGVFGLRERIWAGKFPIIRDGKKIILDKEDLDKFMLSLKETYFLRAQDERENNGRKHK